LDCKESIEDPLGGSNCEQLGLKVRDMDGSGEFHMKIQSTVISDESTLLSKVIISSFGVGKQDDFGQSHFSKG
jgi:hypothetical protein